MQRGLGSYILVVLELSYVASVSFIYERELFSRILVVLTPTTPLFVDFSSWFNFHMTSRKKLSPRRGRLLRRLH